MSRVLESIFSELKAVDFLSSVGVGENELQFITENLTYPQFDEALFSDEWADIRLEAQSALTVFLNSKFQNQYLEWNKIVESARRFCDEELSLNVDFAPDLTKREAIKSEVIDDVVLIIVAKYFIKRVGLKPMFFSKVCEVYKAGHMPCGYKCEGNIDFKKINGTFFIL